MGTDTALYFIFGLLPSFYLLKQLDPFILVRKYFLVGNICIITL